MKRFEENLVACVDCPRCDWYNGKYYCVKSNDRIIDVDIEAEDVDFPSWCPLEDVE